MFLNIEKNVNNSKYFIIEVYKNYNSKQDLSYVKYSYIIREKNNNIIVEEMSKNWTYEPESEHEYVGIIEDQSMTWSLGLSNDALVTSCFIFLTYCFILFF